MQETTMVLFEKFRLWARRIRIFTVTFSRKFPFIHGILSSFRKTNRFGLGETLSEKLISLVWVKLSEKTVGRPKWFTVNIPNKYS
jgi:hypothetical protein